MNNTSRKSSNLMAQNTQADQHNPRSKIKYLTDDDSRVPLTRHVCDYKQSGVMYHADGTKSYRKDASQQDLRKLKESEFTRKVAPKIDDDDEFDDEFSNRFFGDSVSRGTSDTNKCCNKQKYIHAPYEPAPNLGHGGYGPDMDRFAQNKFGISTRSKNKSISDSEMDRTHFTFRNYQDGTWGTFPEPENTRLTNKKTLNNY
jgi:hypothetical protein